MRAVACVSATAPFVGACFGTRPEYQKLRYEEDHRYLRSPDARGDLFDPIKYIPITSDGAAYLSLGGMLRERYEYQSNPLWGDGSQDRSGVFLQRYMLHADLHVGAHARAFAQLQSAVDLYYLGFQDDQGDYVQGTASETRHSVGGRLWGQGGTLGLQLRVALSMGAFRIGDYREPSGEHVPLANRALERLIRAGPPGRSSPWLAMHRPRS